MEYTNVHVRAWQSGTFFMVFVSRMVLFTFNITNNKKTIFVDRRLKVKHNSGKTVFNIIHSLFH